MELGWSENQFKLQFNNETNFSFGLFEFDKINGFVIGNSITIEKKIEYEILLIYVTNKLRKFGYATELLNNISLFLKKKKLKKIYLEVAADNQKAINLYIKNGYIKKGIRKNYYNFKHNKIDAFFFEKIINE